MNDDLRLAGGAIFLRLNQLVEGFDARFGFCLTRLGALPDPLQLVLNRLLTTRIFTRFLLEALALLLKIGRIIAFIDKIATTIELEYPAHHIIEEVAVVGYKDDVALIVDQMLFQPRHRFRVKVVGRFIEQQDVRLFK